MSGPQQLLVGRSSSSASPQPASYANVVLNLHCDGVDGSTTFTDTSTFTKTVTAVNNAQIDTAQSKFGGASALFDGTNDSCTLTGETFGSGDFMVEAWVKRATTGAAHAIYECRDAGTTVIGFLFYINSADKLTFGTGNPFVATSSLISINNTNWHHVAVSRSGTTVRLFIDGSLDATTVSNSSNFTHASHRIGEAVDGTADMNGWLDDIRLVKAEAVYTAGFTPPSAAHPDS